MIVFDIVTAAGEEETTASGGATGDVGILRDV